MSMDMKLRFLVQGRLPEPYVVTFVRVGDDLKTTCTCPAGEKGTYCKHRLALLRGDYSAVVSKNFDELTCIPQILANTDVAAALESLSQAEEEGDKLGRKYALRPPGRRRTIEIAAAVKVLEAGGFLKGRGGATFLDIYDNSDRYCRSLKTSASVFMEDLPARLGRPDVISVVRTDVQLHARSQGKGCTPSWRTRHLRSLLRHRTRSSSRNSD